MRKIIVLVVWLGLVISVISYMIYDAVINNNIPDGATIIKAASSLAVGTLGIFKMFKGHRQVRRPLNYYKKFYSEQLKGVFIDDKKSFDQLVECYRLYDEDRMKDSLKKLIKLKDKCSRVRDKEAVSLVMALCYDDLEMPGKAIDEYNNVLRLNPSHSTSLSNLGLIYVKMDDYRKAIDCYKAAIEADPSNPMAYNNLGAVLFKAGARDEAEGLFLKALDLKPDLRNSADYLAIIYAMKRDIVRSREYYNRSISNGGDAKWLKKSLQEISGDLSVVDELARRWQVMTELESIKIKIGAKSGKSVVGGKLNERAPIDERGNPMRLLAAIFFSEMPPLKDFPSKGVLRFYIAENESYGLDFHEQNKQKNFRVLYDEDESVFESSPFNVASEVFPVKGSFRISFKRVKEAMPFSVDGAQDLFEEKFGEVEDGIFDSLYDSLIVPYSKVGGYPYFTQFDPRENKFKEYDTLLFQLNSAVSNERELIMFGDCGVCNFFISKENLRRRDFSNVLYNWDCC